MLACKSECAPSAIDTALTSTLRNRLQISTLRSLKIAPSGSVDFSSNDFLSLSTSAALRQNFLREVASCTAQNGLGSGGSRLLDGDSEYATRLENDIALFHGAPTGLLFNSGFDANTAFFSCVPQAGDTVIYDELIHASVHEGMRLSRAAKKIPFKHNDVASLEEVICRVRANEGSRHIATGRSVFVAVESVYSMDGDVAKLAEIVEAVKRLCPPGEGLVVVDEAHATGVLGPGGRGLVSQLYLEGDVFARLHTFGKALACGGAIILCSPLVKQYLVNYARPLIYTTFMPFASLAAIHTSYNFLKAGHTVPLAARLNALTIHLFEGLHSLDRRLRNDRINEKQELFQIPSTCPHSPIFSIKSSRPRALAKHCQDGGFVVRAIVAPTVPPGTERIRVCLHAGNTTDEIDRLVEHVGRWICSQKDISVDSSDTGTKMARL